jgi:hypothetical protein
VSLKAWDEAEEHDSLSPSLEILIKKLAPFGTPALTVTGGVHEDDLAWMRSHTEERQSFGAALGMLRKQHDSRRVTRAGGHTGFLLEATSFLRFTTAFSSVDLPTFARPVRR